MEYITREKALDLLEVMSDTDILQLTANILDENECTITQYPDDETKANISVYIRKLAVNPKKYGLIASAIGLRNKGISVDIHYTGISISEYTETYETIGRINFTFGERV